MQAKPNYPLKIGLLAVAFSWFLFTLYQFIKGSLYGAPSSAPFWPLLTDQTAVIGSGFSSTAAFMALVIVLFYFFNKGFSATEAIMTVRWIFLAQAVYWLSLFPSGLWGIVALLSPSPSFNEFNFFIGNLPCLVESILMSGLLVKLFFELSPNKSLKRAIKWGFISGIGLLFVFWYDNASIW